MAELADFDLGILAAQAGVVLADMATGEDTDHLLYDAGRRLAPERWSAVADPASTLEALVRAIGRLPYEEGSQLMLAIAPAPDKSRAIELLQAHLGHVRIWARVLVAETLIAAECEAGDGGHTEADDRTRAWLDDDDTLIRRASAWWWSYRMRAAEGQLDEFERSLSDPDAGVRHRALSWLEPGDLTPELRARLV